MIRDAYGKVTWTTCDANGSSDRESDSYQMEGLQMRMMILVCVFFAASQLVGCDSSSREKKSVEVEPPSQARPLNQNLLSANGELFPLSAYYSICTRNINVLQALIDEGMLGYPTIVEIADDAGKLKIGVGRFGVWPGTVLRDVPATSQPRRIQIAREHGNSYVLVSDFEGAGQNVVSIDYDEADPKAQAAAIRLANSVVACHISAVPSSQNGG